jgi:hypothetical protein
MCIRCCFESIVITELSVLTIMFVLGHLLFELFKISILSSIYAVLIVVILKSLAKYSGKNWIIKVSKKTFRLWLVSGFIFSVFLFSMLFSYWGNHGLGDHAVIPVGYGKTVEQIDDSYTYIRPEGHKYADLPITYFAVYKHYLFGKSTQTDTSNICIWNLMTNHAQFVNTESLNKFMLLNNINESLIFEDFNAHYNKYWNGWRFWLLA